MHSFHLNTSTLTIHTHSNPIGLDSPSALEGTVLWSVSIAAEQHIVHGVQIKSLLWNQWEALANDSHWRLSTLQPNDLPSPLGDRSTVMTLSDWRWTVGLTGCRRRGLRFEPSFHLLDLELLKQQKNKYHSNRTADSVWQFKMTSC